MKRRARISRSGCAIALLFLACGVIAPARPAGIHDMLFGCDRATPAPCRAGAPEIGDTSVRVFGGVAVLFGAGLLWLSWQTPRH